MILSPQTFLDQLVQVIFGGLEMNVITIVVSGVITDSRRNDYTNDWMY